MKNTFTFLLFLWAMASLSGQYHPLAQQGKVWYQKNDAAFLGITTNVFAVQGDTLYNGSLRPLLVVSDSAAGYAEKVAVIIEDTAKQTVRLEPLLPYLRPVEYDFSLRKNDTITFNYGLSSLDWTAVVDTTYMITDLRGNKRRKIVFNMRDTLYCSGVQRSWVEGIGSTTALFQPFPDCGAVAEVAKNIQCVYVDSTAIYDNSGGEPCFVLSEDEYSLSEGIKLYPNPTEGLLYVESARDFHKIEVLDLNGRKIYKTSTGPKIDLSSLPAGIYLLKFSANDGLTVCRRIHLR